MTGRSRERGVEDGDVRNALRRLKFSKCGASCVRCLSGRTFFSTVHTHLLSLRYYTFDRLDSV